MKERACPGLRQSSRPAKEGRERRWMRPSAGRVAARAPAACDSSAAGGSARSRRLVTLRRSFDEVSTMRCLPCLSRLGLRATT